MLGVLKVSFLEENNMRAKMEENLTILNRIIKASAVPGNKF